MQNTKTCPFTYLEKGPNNLIAPMWQWFDDEIATVYYQFFNSTCPTAEGYANAIKCLTLKVLRVVL